jgi:hypothetical protein
VNDVRRQTAGLQRKILGSWKQYSGREFLGFFPVAGMIDLGASTSSSSRSSTRSSKKNSNNGQTLILPRSEGKTDGIEVLPIASFGGQILTTNEDLFTHVLAIDPLPSPRNTKTLKIKLLKSTDKPLNGYVLLIPVFKPNETIWPSPITVFMDRTQLSYIDSELAKRKFEQQDNDADTQVEQLGPENFRIFTDDFRPIRAGKNRNLTGIHRKKSGQFPIGILPPCSSDFRYFPAGSHGIR